MRFTLRPAHCFVAAVCVCQVLVFSSLGQSQAAPDAAQPNQNAQPVRPNLFFEGFVQHVGEEDDRIRSGATADKAQVNGRTDYATAIGIDQGEEQPMLAILVEAHHKEEALQRKERGDETCQFLSSKRWHELLQQYGEAQAWKVRDAEVEGCVKENLAIQNEAWTELNKELGGEGIKRLTVYLNRRPWMPTQQRDPNPCPPNSNPPPGQTTHLACTGFYDAFFYQMGRTDKWNRQKEAEGRDEDRQEINTSITGIFLSEDKRQAVIALGLDAAREIDESDRRFHEACEQYSKMHNGQNVPYPYPPEIDALGRMRGTIVEEYIFKFRQEVGEDIFGQFDKSLSADNRSIMKAPEAPSPASATTPAQAPGVHQ